MSAQDTLSLLLQFVGGVVLVGGGATALTLALFKTWGEKWLDHRFAKRLEEFRHEKDTGPARLFQILAWTLCRLGFVPKQQRGWAATGPLSARGWPYLHRRFLPG